MTAPPPTARVDFADWLSPILVKELRQGLRTRVFIGTFLGLQFLLTTCVVVGLFVASRGGNIEITSAFFWTLVALPLLFVLPCSGLNAISSETRAQTLELLFLTRLSAFRIVFGKWIAVVAQAALLLAAVLPYVVLRYFLGGVDLVGELVTVGLLLAFSVTLTALFIGLSAYPSRIVRVVVVVGAILGLQTVLPILLFARFGSALGGGPVGPTGLMFAVGLSLAFLAGWLALEFGAARIAPAAENHAARKRLLALVLLGTAALGRAVVLNSEPLAVLAFVFAIPVIVGALCEEPAPVRVVRPVGAAFGPAGRWLGVLFRPGWVSGVGFDLAFLALFASLFATYRAAGQWWFAACLVAIAGTLLLPAALVRVFRPRSGRALAWYLGLQGGALVLALAARILDGTAETALGLWLAWIPPVALISLATDGIKAPDVTVALVLGGAALAVAVLGLIGRAIVEVRTRDRRPPADVAL